MRALCAFLGEDFETGMLRFHETEDARFAASLSESWQNTAKPVLAGNAGKYHSELAPEDLALVEGVAGPLMDRLGYARDLPVLPVVEPPAETRLRYRIEDARLRAGIELRSLRRDRNHWRRWSRDATMRYLAFRNRLHGAR